jgi:hypothetical protein
LLKNASVQGYFSHGLIFYADAPVLINIYNLRFCRLLKNARYGHFLVNDGTLSKKWARSASAIPPY